MPATAGNRLSFQVGQPPGTAWKATAPRVTASTDINRAFYRGPSIGGLAEGTGFVYLVWDSVNRNDLQVAGDII